MRWAVISSLPTKCGLKGRGEIACCATRCYLWQLAPHFHNTWIPLPHRKCLPSSTLPGVTSCTFVKKRKWANNCFQQVSQDCAVWTISRFEWCINSSLNHTSLIILSVLSWIYPLDFSGSYHLSKSQESYSHFSTASCFTVQKKAIKAQATNFTILSLSSETDLLSQKSLQFGSTSGLMFGSQLSQETWVWHV